MACLQFADAFPLLVLLLLPIDPEFVAWLDANFDLSAFDTRFAYGRASRLSARSSRASLARSVDVLDKAGSAGGSPRPQML